MLRVSADNGIESVAHILHVIQNLRVGGTERLLQGLLPALRREGVSSSVLCLSSGGEIADEVRGEGFEVAVEGITSYWNPLQVARLRKIVSGRAPSLVHSHGSFANIATGFACRGSGFPPLFTHHHTMWVEDLPRRQCWAEARASARARKVLCVSEAVRTSVVDAGIAPASRTAIVYNGIDTSRFVPSARPGLGNILCVGSLAPHKGHVVLLDALPAVLEAIQGASLTLAGDGSEREALLARAVTLGVAERVRFAGLVGDVRPLLEEADLLVLPSVRREGLGIAVLEAMAAGVPVVASRCGGIPEVVEDGRTGRLVEPGDSGELARVIAEVLLDPATGAELAAAARASVEDRFDVGSTAKRLKRLYQEYIGV
jgi:glycosyltransferase involved in cell wall biosynthesis